MTHGAQAYFQEIRRNGRRVMLATLALEGVVLAMFLATRLPAVRTYLNTPFRPIVRFGFEGPERFVETVVLSSSSAGRAPLMDVGHVQPRRARRGEEGFTPAERELRFGISHLSTAIGLGEGEILVLARSRAREARVPLVEKSDLVVESMLEPEYPEKLHDQNIEGRVALMALVDINGRVIEISIIGSSGFDEFEASAVKVVRLARFRPYSPAGYPQEVYVLIRYRFTID